MKRIEQRHELGEPGFTSRPVKLDIDDLREVLAEMEKLGMSVNIAGNADPVSQLDAQRWRHVDDIATVHPAHMHMLRIEGVAGGDVSGDPPTRQRIRMSMRFTSTAHGVTVTGSADSETISTLSTAITRMRERINAAPFNGLPARYLDRLITGVVLFVALLLWAGWWYVGWQNWPGILFVGLLTVLAFVGDTRWRWKRRILDYIVDRRRWFQQKARKELATERADRHRDLKVGLIVGLPTAVIGAAVGAILTALLG